MLRRAAFLLVFASGLWAAKKPQPPASGEAENADLAVKATVYASPEAVQEMVGSTLDGYYVVVKLELTPKTTYKIDWDNFLLRTDKDGERSHPFKPLQIAGDGALVISETGADGAPAGKKSRGPVWGGFGGMGVGNAQQQTGSKATMQDATGKKDPLVASLTEKMLVEKETDFPASGLLYFPMEKQKVKDLELFVTTPSGKLIIRFTK